MSDEKISMTLNFPKHKRARRKKYQKEYQERHKEEMMQQLGRRFQNQPSTSSAPPDTVEKIPLPTESTSALPFGDSPRLTEKDYETNYMIDPPVVSTHSAELIKSNRVVIKAEEAEKYMMVRFNRFRFYKNVVFYFRSKLNQQQVKYFKIFKLKFWKLLKQNVDFKLMFLI